MGEQVGRLVGLLVVRSKIEFHKQRRKSLDRTAIYVI